MNKLINLTGTSWPVSEDKNISNTKSSKKCEKEVSTEDIQQTSTKNE